MKTILELIKTQIFLKKYKNSNLLSDVDKESFIINNIKYLNKNAVKKLNLSPSLKNIFLKLDTSDQNFETIFFTISGNELQDYLLDMIDNDTSLEKVNVLKIKKLYLSSYNLKDKKEHKNFLYYNLLKIFSLDEVEFLKYKNELNDLAFLKKFISNFDLINIKHKKNFYNNIYNLILNYDELINNKDNELQRDLNRFLSKGKLIKIFNEYLKTKDLTLLTNNFNSVSLLDINKKELQSLESKDFFQIYNVFNIDISVGTGFENHLLYGIENKIINSISFKKNQIEQLLNEKFSVFDNYTDKENEEIFKNCLNFFNQANKKNLITNKQDLKNELFNNTKITNNLVNILTIKKAISLLNALDNNIDFNNQNTINNNQFSLILSNLLQKNQVLNISLFKIYYEVLIHFINFEQAQLIKQLMEQQLIEKNDFFIYFMEKYELEKNLDIKSINGETEIKNKVLKI